MKTRELGCDVSEGQQQQSDSHSAGSKSHSGSKVRKFNAAVPWTSVCLGSCWKVSSILGKAFSPNPPQLILFGSAITEAHLLVASGANQVEQSRLTMTRVTHQPTIGYSYIGSANFPGQGKALLQDAGAGRGSDSL